MLTSWAITSLIEHSTIDTPALTDLYMLMMLYLHTIPLLSQTSSFKTGAYQ
jgi:hypothetical protein